MSHRQRAVFNILKDFRNQYKVNNRKINKGHEQKIYRIKIGEQ